MKLHHDAVCDEKLVRLCFLGLVEAVVPRHWRTNDSLQEDMRKGLNPQTAHLCGVHQNIVYDRLLPAPFVVVVDLVP